MASKSKGLDIPNVWADCKLQVINGERWMTVGSCLWTPNAIKAAVAKLKRHGIVNVWVYTPFDGRKPTF